MAAPLLSRRDWLSKSGAVLAIAALGIPRRSESTSPSEELVLNPQGGYRFLPGVRFLSFGAVAVEGFEIVRTTFRRPRPFPAAMKDIEQLLRESGRPIQALCGLELRSERAFTGPEFGQFNLGYITQFREFGLPVGDQVPVTRTNVAFAPSSPALGTPRVAVHAFCHTIPRTRSDTATTFVLSGMPEIRNLQGADLRGETPDIVARNDTTPAGHPTPSALRDKTEFILTSLDATMRTVGAQWTDVTGVQLYSVHDVQPLLAELILPRIGPAARLGIEWHHAHPPFVQVELGVRGVRLETAT